MRGVTARVPQYLAVLACAVMLRPGDGHSQSNTGRAEIRVLTAQSNETPSAAMRALSMRFPDAIVSSDFSSLVNRPGPGLLVTTDAWSLRVACAVQHALPVIAIYLPAIEAERALVGCKSKMVTTVYADPNAMDKLRLITELYGNRTRVLALLPDDAQGQRARLEKSAASLGLALDIEVVPDQANVARVLTRARAFDVVLASADSVLFTAPNVRTLLEATYRRGVAMIGFSPSTVRAGMLAAAYATPEDSLDALAEIIARIPQSGALPTSRHPKHWRIAFNETVARSLSIPIPPEWIAGEPRPAEATK